MGISKQRKNQHLLWRAGFGPAAEQITAIADLTPQEVYREMVKQSGNRPACIQVATNWGAGLVGGIQDAIKNETVTMNMNGETVQLTKQEIRKKQREEEKSINLRWINEMITTPAQLREKMAFFWHGHFACRNINSYFQQILLNTIRENALGKFSTLLSEVSKTASMLQFLNNQQNKKQKPNENFAREVMELFTLGRGNYTENDIKEAARAFTGWGFNLEGDFVFRENFHDAGSKTILGYTGNFNGDDVLEILLQKKETALFITRKIYRFFVNENTIDENRVNWLANRFYNSEYHIQQLLDDIFLSDWFYDPRHIGSRIKSPVELLVGFRRILPMELQTEEVQLLFQKLLGQILLYPPNVAGWPGGKWWIDSSSLFYRMRMPQVVNAADELNVQIKADDDTQMGRMNDDMLSSQRIKGFGKTAANMKARIDWAVFFKPFKEVPRDQLAGALCACLLQTDTIDHNLLSRYADKGSREEFIKSLTIYTMSTPEYQLC